MLLNYYQIIFFSLYFSYFILQKYRSKLMIKLLLFLTMTKQFYANPSAFKEWDNRTLSLKEEIRRLRYAGERMFHGRSLSECENRAGVRG